MSSAKGSKLSAGVILTTRNAAPGSEIGSGGSPSRKGFSSGFWYPTVYPGGIPAPLKMNVTWSRQPFAPACASISDPGAVGPTDVNTVVEPTNPGHELVGAVAAG